MSDEHRVTVPDLGDFDDVEIIEVLVAVGDEVVPEQGLVTLETDKAAMDVPSPTAGRVRELLVSVGDRVGKGSEILVLEVTGSADDGDDDRAAGADDDPGRGDSPGASTTATPRPAAAERKKAATPSAESSPSTPSSEAPSLPEADRRAALLVLGAGPGGYTAAFRAADLGMDVTLVERWPVLGGVCLNVGCIPSKALLHAARVIDEAAAFTDHGLRFGTPEIDLERLRAWKDGVVERLVGGLSTLAEKRGVQVVTGSGRFLGPQLLEVDGVDGSTTIAFEQCIIAAGSEPVRLPGWPEDPRIIDSTGALELESLPDRLLVVGGGIIGLEMATVYAALGVEVDIVEMTEGLMPGADRDLVRPLEKRLRRLCRHIMLGTRVTDVRAGDAALEVSFDGAGASGEDPVAYDRVLVAVGRRANGDTLDAAAAGVEIDQRGLIQVDRQMRSNVAHIFAIGDLAGGPMLAHKAVHEGKVAAEVAAGQNRAFDARVIPSVAYTDPEVAWVGLTETAAKDEGIRYEKGVFPWAASGRSLAMGRDEGLTKLLFDPETHRVIGGGIVGTNAGDLIAEVALAIEMGADAADIGLTIHPHPTLSETVAMAAEAFEGTLTDLLPPKRSR